MSRVHIYCRVSSAGQEDGYSLDTQEQACRAWAAERSLPVASVAREVFSSGELHRPELDAMIARLQAGDVLLAYTPDRLSRHQKHPHILEYLIEQQGARLAYVTQESAQSEEDVLLSNVGNYTSAAERAKIRERTQRGRRARVASGKPIAGGKPRYGYLWADAKKSRLELDPETAPIVRLIFDMALAGASMHAIAKSLQERRISSPGGKVHWRRAAIHDILRCPTYTGDAVAYRQRFERKAGGAYARRPGSDAEMVTLPGIAPAIVTPDELATVAARLERNKAESKRHNLTPERSLLRAGFIRCGHCGRSLGVRNVPKNRPGTAAQYQRCQTPGCPAPSIATSVIDAAIWAKVRMLLQTPGIITAALEKHRNDGGQERDLVALDKRLESIATKQRNLAQNMALLSEDAAAPLREQLEGLTTARKATEADRAELLRRMADEEADAAKVRTLTDWAGHFALKLDTATYDDKRMALEALGVQVYINKLGSVDELGNPCDRWYMTMRPLAVGAPIVYATARSADSGQSR